MSTTSGRDMCSRLHGFANGMATKERNTNGTKKKEKEAIEKKMKALPLPEYGGRETERRQEKKTVEKCGKNGSTEQVVTPGQRTRRV